MIKNFSSFSLGYVVFKPDGNCSVLNGSWVQLLIAWNLEPSALKQILAVPLTRPLGYLIGLNFLALSFIICKMGAEDCFKGVL